MALQTVERRFKDNNGLSYTWFEKNVSYRFVKNGDFTICVLKTKGHPTVAVGASKRNPIDTLRPEVGKALALRRALEAAYGNPTSDSWD
jgi:hypothetical protein